MTLAGQMGMDSALERVEQSEWLVNARLAIATFCSAGQTFTAEDVRHVAGDPPGSGNALGSLLHHIAEEGWIEQDGWEQALRPEARGRVIRRWRSA